jgi:hypothetical protein
MSKNKQNSDFFVELLVAAMKDAAVGFHLTQFKTQIDPGDGKGIKVFGWCE